MREKANLSRALFIGRFQPFHLGHLHAIKEALDQVEEIVIVVGSAQYSHTARDPFTAGERLVMIRKALEKAGISDSRFWIIPVPDVHLHMMWVSAVRGYTPNFDVVFSNEPLTQRLFMENGFKVNDLQLLERQLYSSTKIREMMIKDESWTELVPKSVASFVKEIDGINRLKDLVRSDKI